MKKSQHGASLWLEVFRCNSVGPDYVVDLVLWSRLGIYQPSEEMKIGLW